jgi:hypothetical protein
LRHGNRVSTTAAFAARVQARVQPATDVSYMLSDLTNATIEQIVLEADGVRGKEWKKLLYPGRAQANKYRRRGWMNTGADKLSAARYRRFLRLPFLVYNTLTPSRVRLFKIRGHSIN